MRIITYACTKYQLLLYSMYFRQLNRAVFTELFNTPFYTRSITTIKPRQKPPGVGSRGAYDLGLGNYRRYNL